MAEAKLNFDENMLDKESGIYDLYSRLYEGMRLANKVDAPSFENPPLTADGEIDTVAISNALANHSDILMKNSAYLFANSIVTVIGVGGGGGTAPGSGYVSRYGDSMIGHLSALCGFQAGYDGNVILETLIDSAGNKWVDITGGLRVSENAHIDGRLVLSKEGIYFGETQTVFVDQSTLHIISKNISLDGNVNVSDSLRVGNILIDKDGIYNDKFTYYHSGNSNKADVDWSSYNANVHGSLNVFGQSEFSGLVNAEGGISLGAFGIRLLYTDNIVNIGEDGTEENRPFVVLSSDLNIVGGHGIKVDESYVVKLREGAIKTVSFSAPNMIMNLGDSDGDVKTRFIALQSELRDHTGGYSMISQYGDADFRNSFSAGCGNAGPSVIRTFASDDHCGVVVSSELRFGNEYGPALYGDHHALSGSMTYLHVVNGMEQAENLKYSISNVHTTSPFADISKPWSATLQIDTESEFVRITKTVESPSFAIKSERYKTRLVENALFFDDGKFIEGVPDGLRHYGNAYFDANLSSARFASGFAGYGWAIKKDTAAGGISATFDELTIRKKMRVYELEVQKNSVTNGSLWVSDSCSGDEVRAL